MGAVRDSCIGFVRKIVADVSHTSGIKSRTLSASPKIKGEQSLTRSPLKLAYQILPKYEFKNPATNAGFLNSEHSSLKYYSAHKTWVNTFWP